MHSFAGQATMGGMTEAPPRETRVLRRSGEGRIFGGVCAGLGRFTGIDPVVFRVGFAVLLLGSGVGFILYVAAVLLMKDPRGGRASSSSGRAATSTRRLCWPC